MLSIALCCSAIYYSHAQTVFRHVTSAANTNAHIRWFIYNSQNEAMPLNAAFNILAINESGNNTAGTLWGFADLHTHPATHLAFGANAQGKNLFWGSPGLELAGSDIARDLPPCNHDEHAWDELDPVRRETRKTVARSLCGEYTG